MGTMITTFRGRLKIKFIKSAVLVNAQKSRMITTYIPFLVEFQLFLLLEEVKMICFPLYKIQYVTKVP